MTQNGKVPFVDLVTPHRELQPELMGVFQTALETAGFVGGPAVEAFEREFSDYCDTTYCVGVSSGTDALRFALTAAGVKQGDIVITAPLTFIATTEAISQSGARPGFVDVDSRTYTMDPQKLREYLENDCVMDAKRGCLMDRRLNQPVTAIIPVHLYGQIADMDPILDLAARYKLIVIEDACQAHGAEYFSNKEQRWRKAGSMGRAAAFSFYPGKNLGACGEGGAVTTSDKEIARVIGMLRDHGQSKKYHHDMEGYNGRLDSIQAGILRVKLKHLDRWNEQRRESARLYDEMLAPLNGDVTSPFRPPWSKPVNHLYVIRTANRDGLQAHLTKLGVGTGIHYPIPVHLQAPYASMGWKRGDFPVAEQAADQILSLPMFGGLKADQQRQVTEAIAQFTVAYSTP